MYCACYGVTVSFQIKGVFEEVPLPLFTVPNVFNDTAVHAFPPDKLQVCM